MAEKYRKAMNILVVVWIIKDNCSRYLMSP